MSMAVVEGAKLQRCSHRRFWCVLAFRTLKTTTRPYDVTQRITANDSAGYCISNCAVVTKVRTSSHCPRTRKVRPSVDSARHLSRPHKHCRKAVAPFQDLLQLFGKHLRDSTVTSPLAIP